MYQKAYDRRAALLYAQRWGRGRNPAYFDFTDLGGDCTNFISQCVYAGSGVMNYTPTYGWYYIDAQDRTASWTGVEYFYNFMTANDGPGPHMTEVPVSQIRPGDVIQLGRRDGSFYHSLLVTRTGFYPSVNNIYITTHSFDAYMRRLNTYEAEAMRFLHVDYVNVPEPVTPPPQPGRPAPSAPYGA